MFFLLIFLRFFFMFWRERNVLFNDALNTFFYGYMMSDIWLRTILIVRKETRCCHIGCSYRLTARVLLYAPSHRQDNTYHSLCYTSHGALAGTRNSSMGPPHEPWRIDPTTHRTMSECSTSELRPAPSCFGGFVILTILCFSVLLCYYQSSAILMQYQSYLFSV